MNACFSSPFILASLKPLTMLFIPQSKAIDPRERGLTDDTEPASAELFSDDEGLNEEEELDPMDADEMDADSEDD